MKIAFEANRCCTQLVALLDWLKANAPPEDFEVQKRWIAETILEIGERLDERVYEQMPDLREAVREALEEHYGQDGT